MADLVEDIKARLDVLTLVSQYLQLKKMGRSYKALSPFKNEKTPSFVVSPEKQIWHDFSTGKGGDIFTFVQEYESVEFSEALRILADKAGLDMDSYRTNKSVSYEHKSEKDEMYKANELATKFFHGQLLNTKEGEKVREYLYKRGVKDETIELFQLGFAPDTYDSLNNFLIEKGVSKKTLLKVGLVSSKTVDADKVFDKFRGRLMFPIHDILGRVCGFGGRALIKDQAPKYLNSPESPIYNKSKTLFGLFFSKNDIKKEDKIVIVEGYFDVIMPFQEGVRNLVATSGTALTTDHIKLITRYTNNIVSSFDSDEAGFNATLRAYELLNARNLGMKCVTEMKGKDPADFVKEDKDGFMRVVAEAKDFMDFYMEKLIAKSGTDSFEKIRTIVTTLLPYLKALPSINRDHYIRRLSFFLKLNEQSLYDEVESFFASPSLTKKDNEINNMNVPGKIKNLTHEEVLFSLILEYPFLFEKIANLLEENDFSDEFKLVYKILNSQYNPTRNLDKWDFSAIESDNLKNRLSVLALYGEDRYGSFSKVILQEEVTKLLITFKKARKTSRLKDILIEIANAEAQNDMKKLIELLEEQKIILSKE